MCHHKGRGMRDTHPVDNVATAKTYCLFDWGVGVEGISRERTCRHQKTRFTACLETVCPPQNHTRTSSPLPTDSEKPAVKSQPDTTGCEHLGREVARVALQAEP
uniref:Uncharacterized protein n=1 Tax=Eutreptiella gymnastica TaxID=73025 RepID=A0A7S1ILH7_9EUGL|mmetsp:Transcript_2761/g.4955  ORF Transcript_2761/g.4955 Transcript_2761/m.4955 type:complete len:104 (+) Transcript_2761:496-807(+)